MSLNLQTIFCILRREPHAPRRAQARVPLERGAQLLIYAFRHSSSQYLFLFEFRCSFDAALRTLAVAARPVADITFIRHSFRIQIELTASDHERRTRQGRSGKPEAKRQSGDGEMGSVCEFSSGKLILEWKINAIKL